VRRKPGDTTHVCGACGLRLFTARLLDTGLLLHVERDPKAANGDLELVLDLPGVADGELPHVTRVTTRRTAFRAHDCPKVRSFSADATRRKVRP
jgi:hypothetical protein